MELHMLKVMSIFTDSRRLNFSLFVIYKLLLDITYITIQSDVFEYSGYNKVIIWSRILTGWGVFLSMSYFICRWKNNVYSLFLYVMHLMTIVPLIVLFQYNIEYKLWMVLAQCICILFMMFIFKIPQKVCVVNQTHKIGFNNKKFQFILITSLLIYTLFIYFKFGIPTFESMLLANISETRAEAEISLVLSLFQNLFCRIILPFCILWYTKNRHWLLVAFCLFVQIYTYAVTGYKTYLFIPFVLLTIQFVRNIKLDRVVICGMITIILIVDCLYFNGQDIIWYALVCNRLIFLTAKIKYSYFDYFSNHDFAYFSQSSFAQLIGIKSNYSENIPNMIGEEYFDKPQMWTNTGFIADAYSNMGYIGIMIMAIVLAIVLRYANSITKQIPSPYNIMVEAVFLLFFISLNDGAVISVLFSGGMIAAIFFFHYIDFNDKSKIKSPRIVNQNIK